MSMMMEGIVKDVEVRKIKNGTMTVYDVVDAEGVKWTAWEKELAERAYALKDQPALLEVDVEQKGKWTNRNLRGIEGKPVAGFTPALEAMSASLGTEKPPSLLDAKEALTEAPSYRDRSIFRQTAAKVAAHLAEGGSSPEEFWANTRDLAAYFESGVLPSGGDKAPAVAEDDIPF